jgi:hypothetical protein
VITILAQAATKQELFRSAVGLWIAFALLGLLVVGSVWVLLSRQRKTLTHREHRPRAREIKDAWAEAGRRAEPATIDEDPPEARG